MVWVGLVSNLLPPRPKRRRIIQSDWNEQSSTKKDPDASTSLPNGRDRRYVSCVRERFSSLSNPGFRSFRRDADDAGTFLLFRHTLRVINPSLAENSTARNFRTTLAQPSQMGNFRHQSTRTTERDREKGSGEDREAKDGQERLRSVCVTPASLTFMKV